MSARLPRVRQRVRPPREARPAWGASGGRGQRGPPPQPVQPARPSSGPPAAHRGFDSLPEAGGREDIRIYAVWSLPQPREGPGIYIGPHPTTWNLLEWQSGNQNPLVAGARLRRYQSVDEAFAAWVTAAPSELRRSPGFQERTPALWVVTRAP